MLGLSANHRDRARDSTLLGGTQSCFLKARVVGLLDPPCVAQGTVKSNLGVTPAALLSTLIHFEIPLVLEQFH